jgi:hypothetical protein
MAKRNPVTGVRPAPERRAGAPRKRTPRKSSALKQDAAMSARDIDISEEELRRQISEAAYYKAEQRGFAPGYEHQDWVEAEAEVRSRLRRSG